MNDMSVDTAHQESDNKQLPEHDQCTLLELVKQIDSGITSAVELGKGNVDVVDETEQREFIGYTICFTVAGMSMAIPLSSVQEAGQLQNLRRLPLLPDWLAGITNIRGEIVSVVNLESFLESHRAQTSPDQPYLVVHNNNMKVAITVDGLIGTRSLYRLPERLANLPQESNRPQHFFAGWAVYLERDAEKEISLFDVDEFLSSQKLLDAATA